jgi:hypothetical protein
MHALRVAAIQLDASWLFVSLIVAIQLLWFCSPMAHGKETDLPWPMAYWMHLCCQSDVL